MIQRIILFTFVWLLGFTTAFGQRQDTIYQNLAIDVTPGNTDTVTYGPVTNIGQGYHQAFLSLSNITGGSVCNIGSPVTATSTQIKFYTSPPGQGGGIAGVALATQQYISPNYSGLGTGGVVFATATTIYPFVYVTVQGIDHLNCKFTLTYTGSLYPVTPPIVTFNSTEQNNIIGNPTLLPISFTGSRAATTTVIPVTHTVQHNIYTMTLSNTTAAQNVTLKCGGTTLDEWDNLQAGQIIVLPFTNNIWYLCNDANVTVTLANATKVNMTLQYKQE